MTQLEQFSIDAARLVTDIQQKFGDEGSVQITPEMILRWTNDGIRSLASEHSWLSDIAQTNLIATQNAYDLATLFASNKIKSIETITADGKPIELIPWATYLARIQNDDIQNQAGPAYFGTLRGATLTLWPVPTTTVANGLKVYYTPWPAEVANSTAGTKLTSPDRLYDALNDYVFAKALELNANWEASAAKLGQYEVNSRREYEKQNASPTDFYPTITADPQDDVESGSYT